MKADIYLLYRSDVYRIIDFKCHCDICSVSNTEYNEGFYVSFIRKGFFEYRTFRRNEEMHVGRVLVSKPGFEHTTRHIDSQPDITTCIEFRNDFFKEIQQQYAKEAGWFFNNPDIHSLLIQCSPGSEYLHHHILQLISQKKTNSLQIDEMVMDLLHNILSTMGNIKEHAAIPGNLKKFHLGTIESAKDYILKHFRENFSLHQLAQHCCVSAFHFSRLFKTVMNTSPHQFLTSIRLQHAKQLLISTTSPV